MRGGRGVVIATRGVVMAALGVVMAALGLQWLGHLHPKGLLAIWSLTAKNHIFTHCVYSPVVGVTYIFIYLYIH